MGGSSATTRGLDRLDDDGEDLKHRAEIKLHVKGALNNGVTVEEIKAALLHATAYCGIPAGLDAFRAAHEVLVSEGLLPKPVTPAR